MDSTKYIGMDVHKESISIAVLNSTGKLVMECVIETKASMAFDLWDAPSATRSKQVPYTDGSPSHSNHEIIRR